MMKVKSIMKQMGGLHGFKRQHLLWPKSAVIVQHFQARQLSELITPELSQTLAGKFTRKKFKVAAIKSDLEMLEDYGFPLPDSLSMSQWQQLMELENRHCKTKYFDIMFTETDMQPLSDEQFQQLLEEDKKLVGPLRLDQRVVDSIKTRLSQEQKDEVIEQLKETHEILLQEGHRVLAEIPEKEFAQLLDPKYNTSRRSLTKTLLYILRVHNQDINDLIKKRARQAKLPRHKEAHRKAIAETEHIYYGLGANTINLRLPEKKMEKADDWKCIREFHSWGQPLVIDLSFVKHLTYQAAMSLIDREIAFGLKINRVLREPFPIYITSYDKDCGKCSLMEKKFERIKNESWESLPYHITAHHYTDLFPKKNLLILSPDSRNDLIEYDPNDIYVIGGIVEKAAKTRHTLDYARHNEIRHARFPMKRVLGMHHELNVDSAMAVIADFKNDKDWFKAFRWVPARKFAARLNGVSFTPRMEADYLARKELSPCYLSSDFAGMRLLNMKPKQYREAYDNIVSEHLKGVKHPDRHIANTKYISQAQKRRDRMDHSSLEYQLQPRGLRSNR